jgi:FkbM family methyltransferase
MSDIYVQILALLGSINELLETYRSGTKLGPGNWADLHTALLSVGLPQENIIFNLIERVKVGNTDKFEELSKYYRRFYDAQLTASARSLTVSDTYKDEKYGSDREFAEYIRILHENTHSSLVQLVYDRLREVKENQPEYYKLITDGSRGWYFENNWLDGIDGANNSLIANRISTLKNNITKLEWLYDNLADAVSRMSLNALIKFWLTWDTTPWREVALYYCDVVDTSIFTFYDDEVFVDCGSYIGDTVTQYIAAVNDKYKRVYTYDISRKSIEQIRQNLAQYPNIVIRHKGTGAQNTKMAEVGVDAAFHGNKLSSDGRGNIVDTVDVVRLDDDITEPITFLKIDCEGMDKETLRGARGHIQKYHPRIHVDSYHKLRDIVDIPELIRGFDPTYSLFMRLPLTLNTPPRFPAPMFIAI